MSRDLRTLLLTKIISSEGMHPYKYSACFNALKSVIDLENKDKDDRLNKVLFDKFKDIEKSITNLDERIKDFPLLIVEEYLMRNQGNLDKYIYLTYNNLENTGDIQVMDLYIILEKFFEKMYHLAVEIADYYSLDVKLKSSNENQEIF